MRPVAVATRSTGREIRSSREAVLACVQLSVEHTPFRALDALAGMPSPVFQTWLTHPMPDACWDSLNPTEAQYSRIDMPILTITGIYDGDQLGAVAHYRQHMKNASPSARGKHFLIIGPRDHAGTREGRTATSTARSTRRPRGSRTTWTRPRSPTSGAFWPTEARA